MTDAVTLPNHPLTARLLLPVWVVQTGMGLVFALAGLRLLGPGENGGAAVLIILGLVLAAAGVVMTALSWRSAWLKGTAIEMTAEGFRDRRLSAELIPWEAVSWKLVFNGRSHAVQIDIAAPWRERLSIFWAQRALGRFNRLLRHPEFTVLTLATGRSAHDIAALITPFKPAA
jgi:hypothetical protein